MSLLRVAGAAVVVAVAVGAVASPAWATVTWQDPPTDVSAPAADVYSGSPQTAAGPDGSILVVWAAYGPDAAELKGRLWADGAWSATESSISGPTADLGDYAVVARADGSYMVVWNSAEAAVQSSILTAGTWSKPTALTVPAVDEELGQFALAAAPNGMVIASWVRDDFVDAAVLGGSGWATTQELGLGGDASVAALPTNVLAVTWRSQADGSTGPSARVYSGGSWGSTTLLSATDGFSPNLIAGPKGFVSMWMDGARLPWASTYTGGSWSPKVALRESNQIGGGLTSPGPIASTPSGTAVTWLDGEFNNGPMVWARVFSGTAWAAPLEVIPSTQQAVNVQLVGRPNGSYVIAWQGNGGGNPIMARTFTASSVGNPVELAPAIDSPNSFSLTAASNGYVVATWLQQGSVVARVFDGVSWSAETTVLGEGSSQVAVASSDNVFMVAWEWYDNTSGLVRASTFASPEGAGGGGDGGDELAETGLSPLVAGFASALAIVLLVAGCLLVVRRRQHA